MVLPVLTFLSLLSKSNANYEHRPVSFMNGSMNQSFNRSLTDPTGSLADPLTDPLELNQILYLNYT